MSEIINGAATLDGDGTDLSGNDLTAEPTNPEWVAGMYVQALRFDGDNELRVSANPSLEVAQVTMMAWVRPGVFETRAAAFRPRMALIALDFPTFDRPAKAISGRPVAGGDLGKEPRKRTPAGRQSSSYRGMRATVARAG